MDSKKEKMGGLGSFLLYFLNKAKVAENAVCHLTENMNLRRSPPLSDPPCDLGVMKNVSRTRGDRDECVWVAKNWTGVIIALMHGTFHVGIFDYSYALFVHPPRPLINSFVRLLHGPFLLIFCYPSLPTSNFSFRTMFLCQNLIS